MLNLMVEKGKLAASIRKNIVKNKNLFSTVGRNADTIEGAGSVIDRATAQKIKLDAESVLPQFDALKYSPGKISDLLNEGAQEISQGAKVNVVAKRIQRQILDEIKPQEITPSSVADEVIPEAGADLARNEKINQIVAKAAANGEVRPPTTPLIKTPATSGVSLEKVADDLAAGKITDDVQKAISDELRLSEEFEKMDLGMKAAETDGKRTEMGWDGMTFEEKKANGLVPEKLSDVLRKNLKALAQSDARRLREVDRVLKESRAAGGPPPVGTDIPRGEAAQTGAVFIERVDKSNKELIGEQKGIVDKTMARLVLANEKLPKTYDLAVLELQELNATQLAELNLTKADLERMTPRRTINILKRNFDDVREDLLPGEYRMEGYSESRRKLYKKWFKDDPDVTWVDRETSKASTISDKNSIPYLVIKDEQQAFEDWVKNPPDEYKELFKNIEETSQSIDLAINEQKAIFKKIKQGLDEQEQILKEGSQYDELSPIDQKKVDLEVGMQASSRKIQPGTPHPTDANKVRGYDSRWVTKKYFDQVTQAQKGANEIREQFHSKFELPPELKRLKPRYGAAVPEFESELDAVAYSIRSNKTKSKREDDYVAVLEKFGYSKAEVAEHGKKVHQYIKDFVKEQRGTAQANAAAGLDIQVPDQGFKRGGLQASAFPSDVDFTDGKYPGDDAMRNFYRRVQEREAVREADYLAEWGAKIADSDMGRLAQSQQLAAEAVEAVRGAAITSGIMPARIKWMDELDMTKVFGEEEHIGAMRNWSPQAATFMARNPGDPLNKTAAGLTTGVYVSQTFEKAIRGSIVLALHPSIDQRYGGALRKLPSIGRRFYTLGKHEAFHGVQEFLYLSGDKKIRAALKTPQAIAEMKEIIRKSSGNTMENMDVMEIQAEAFGNWANNRNLKLKDGGLKASFEKIKKFVNGVRARVRKILRKDPTYIDIFEMAHSGELARKKLLNTLSPAQLDAYAKRIDRQSHEMLPELTERINDYLTAKKLEYDTLINGWELDAASGGCL